MDLATILGLTLGFGALIGGFLIEGGTPTGLLNISAAIIVLGGTVAAAMVSFPLATLLGVPKAIVNALVERRERPTEVLHSFVGLAEKARREGLLSLEQEAQALRDPFTRKGVLMVVDGMDPEVIQNILETDIASAKQRHEHYYAVLEAMGGYSPTMGIIGTVMGLVNVLSNLSEPGELGHAIAVAFIATLYGVSTANVVYLPLANKLKQKSKEEAHMREVMLEGVLSIQSGDNPRVVQEKLEAFLPAAARRGGAGHAASAAQPEQREAA
ncbi:MAG: flagellar motor protein [Chloroflexi bacterium]|nr:flagellar motor protein [Chloroflexota bacterium]